MKRPKSIERRQDLLTRDYIASDLPALFEINQAGVPGVGNETLETLKMWINLSTVFVAADDKNTPLGFLTLIEPGTKDYDSQNLRWFEAYIDETGRDLVYVDRIAVAETARGQTLGQRLYEAAFKAFASRGEIGCEINISPPNPGSMRFHARLGFRQIGTRSYGNEGNAVAYYVRDLP